MLEKEILTSENHKKLCKRLQFNKMWFYEKYHFSECFARKFEDKMYFEMYLRNNKVSEKYIEEKIEQYSHREWFWWWVSINGILSEAFIEKYSHNVAWEQIIREQKISENLIENNIDKLPFHGFWSIFRSYFKFSESFIEKYATTQQHWYDITSKQKLSDEFIIRNFNKFKQFDKLGWVKEGTYLDPIKHLKDYQNINTELELKLKKILKIK